MLTDRIHRHQHKVFQRVHFIGKLYELILNQIHFLIVQQVSYKMMHPAEWVLVTCWGFDPLLTSCTILATSSKSGKAFVLSFEWINCPSTVTSKEAK